MLIFSILIWAIELLLIFYFSFVTLYNLVIAIASLFHLRFTSLISDAKNSFAIFIPAYREDDVIVSSAENILQQQYPSDKFEIFVIADSLKPETITRLKKLPIKVLEVEFDKSTKVKSIQAAFEFNMAVFDICLILDADNFLDANFLQRGNSYFSRENLSIQGMRVPKNSDSNMAYLDGVSEAINNNIVRKGTSILGGSSAIVGSGFFVDYSLLKEVMEKMDSTSGFDKELEIRLLERGVKTRYANDLIVYDEKVSNTKDFERQRRRWVFSQFYYLKKYFQTSIKAFFSGNFALFNSAFLRYAQLPRFLNLVLLFLFSILFTFYHYANDIMYVWWTLFVGLVVSTMIAIPRRFYTIKMWNAIWHLPKIFFIMLGILFKLKGTNEKYIHTPHNKVDIEQ